jgi:hypothetical protein
MDTNAVSSVSNTPAVEPVAVPSASAQTVRAAQIIQRLRNFIEKKETVRTSEKI